MNGNETEKVYDLADRLYMDVSGKLHGCLPNVNDKKRLCYCNNQQTEVSENILI